ncbi:hypothetical protein GCM10011379_45550 [Filimonas zeae]|uniref:Phage protein D n=2 Tax=Filimonas zeae TaxID=1737353 RepID=A0A917J284_9BACT|nr:hypothetical protein GCM10011379_45550 [Filimonas zeae]
MFLMTNNITIGDFKPFKCTSVSWNRSIDNYADSAKITMPGVGRLKKGGDQYGLPVSSGMLFKKGMPVEIACGYNGNNSVRFKGFVKKINYSIPLEIECEGYSYQLQADKKTLKKNYEHTTVRKILEDVVAGTGVKLSAQIPHIPVIKAPMAGLSGVKVLEWLKENMLLTAYFNFDELYVGLRYVDVKRSQEVVHRLGWNVIKDKELDFDESKSDTKVNITLEVRKSTGVKKKVEAPAEGGKKSFVVVGVDPESDFLKKLHKDIQTKEYHKGYSGKLTCFLDPVCDLNMVSVIRDARYIERAGKYVIESVEGSFSSSGGRQKVGVGVKL